MPKVLGNYLGCSIHYKKTYKSQEMLNEKRYHISILNFLALLDHLNDKVRATAINFRQKRPLQNYWAVPVIYCGVTYDGGHKSPSIIKMKNPFLEQFCCYKVQESLPCEAF